MALRPDSPYLFWKWRTIFGCLFPILHIFPSPPEDGVDLTCLLPGTEHCGRKASYFFFLTSPFLYLQQTVSYRQDTMLFVAYERHKKGKALSSQKLSKWDCGIHNIDLPLGKMAIVKANCSTFHKETANFHDFLLLLMDICAATTLVTLTTFINTMPWMWGHVSKMRWGELFCKRCPTDDCIILPGRTGLIFFHHCDAQRSWQR